MVFMFTTFAFKQAAASLLALLFLLAMGTTHGNQSVARQGEDTKDIVPVAQIIAAVKASHGGDVLEITLREKGDFLYYNVMLADAHGVVWSLHYDATKGTLLGMSKDEQSGKDTMAE